MFNPLLVLSRINFPNDSKENSLRKNRKERVRLIRSEDDGLRRVAGAVIIQAAFRGWNTRRKYLAVKYSDLSFKSNRGSLGHPAIGRVGLNRELEAQEKLIQKYCKYSQIYEKLYSQEPDFPYFAAAYIQAVWRTFACRRIYDKYQAVKHRNATMSARARSRLSRYGSFLRFALNVDKPGLTIWDRSAIIIQRAWKSFNGKRIFSFYKSLLSIWQSNNSCRLLKFINPQESKLIEAATGLHVKFRLGGVSFV